MIVTPGSGKSNDTEQTEIVATGIETEANARLLAKAPELRDALEMLLKAFEAFTHDANWGASALRADTIRQANEVPGMVRALLAHLDGTRA